MKVLQGDFDKTILERPTGIGLGNFDGLHIGHMALINTLISESDVNSLHSIVYTFTKHPENILRKKLFTPLITSVEKKTELLNQTSLDYLYFEEFDEKFSRLSPKDFVKNILINKMKMRLAVVGYDYRFGFKGSGDVQLLKLLGKEYDFKVIVIPPIEVKNQIVGSTEIRKHISKGNMDKTFELLGRHYSLSGTVVRGRRIGNTIGFPTANIISDRYLVIPKNGVYITKTLVKGRYYKSITNIGKNPTFGTQSNNSVETHIIGFSDDIYGENIEVIFISRIRSEKKFSGKEELILQIEKDLEKAENFYIY